MGINAGKEAGVGEAMERQRAGVRREGEARRVSRGEGRRGEK
jgi:hypothetical protein